MAGNPEARIFTRAPVSTGQVVWRARGQLYVTVVVKASFGLVDEQAMELLEPAELFRGELHHRDNPSRSVRATSDVVPYLNRADVVLTGHACAPSGEKASMVTVRLAVFREQAILDKTAHVHGDRKGGVATPFDKMPLVYEKAVGGVGWDDNPLGQGMRAGGTPDPTAANIVHPTEAAARAGFGPISRTWPARRRLLGKTDRKALDKPVVVLPDAFDWTYFQAAPPDQQIDFLRGDEWIVLEGMHPHMARITSRLPNARAIGRVTGLSAAEGQGLAAPRELDFHADILRIDADEQGCSVVWRSAVAVPDEASIEGLLFTVGLEMAGRSIEWSDDSQDGAEADTPSPETIDLDDEDIAIFETVDSIDESDFAKTIPREDRMPKTAPWPKAVSPVLAAPRGAEASAPRPEKTALWTAEMAAELRKPPPGFEGTVALPQDEPGPSAAKQAVPFTPVKGGAPKAISRHEGTMALSPEDADLAAKKPKTPFAGDTAPRSRSFVARPVPGAPWAPRGTKLQPPKPRFDQTVTSTFDVSPRESAPDLAQATLQLPRAQVDLSQATLQLPRAQVDLSQETLQLSRATLDLSRQTLPDVSYQAVPEPPRTMFEPLREVAPEPQKETTATAAVAPEKVAEGRTAKPSEAPREKPLEAPRAASIKAQDVPRREQDSVPVVHHTPFVIFTVPWQLKAGGMESLAIVVKATCDLLPNGAATLRKSADPPSGDLHEGGDPARTLLYSSDFAVFKPHADVMLAGHAYPPGGSSAAAQARFRFGSKSHGFDRRIAVFGERKWQKAGIKLSPTSPRPFKKVPLLYERAFGGAGFDRNPAGVGIAGDVLPQLEDPASLVKSPGDAPEPMCFAGVPAAWAPRRSKLGTFGAEWKKERWPYFPDDFDWEYFQAAPPAQQLDYLQGDEGFELSGVHAEHPSIKGKLPGIRPRCFAQKTSEAGGEFHEVLLRLDTVLFEPESMKLTLVWRGLLDVVEEAAEDIAELFVACEPTAGPPVERAEAFSKYRAAKLATAPALLVEDGEPANDQDASEIETPEPPAELTAQESAALRAQVEGLLAEGAALDGMDLSRGDFSGLDFTGRSLKGALLVHARLHRCKLVGANLSGAQLDGADLSFADLSQADLSQADLTRADLTNGTLEGVSLEGAILSGVRAEAARFCDARGGSAAFVGAFLRKARFDRAALQGADFTRADMDFAVFDAASLPDVRLYDARASGASFNGAKLDGARADGVTLKRCSLQRIQARSSVWDKACLDESSFLGAVLVESGLAKVSCRRTIFSGADLTGARLRRGVFRGAAFLKANLMTASLEAADLEGADLRGANLHGAETHRAALAGAKLDLAITTQTKLAEVR